MKSSNLAVRQEFEQERPAEPAKDSEPVVRTARPERRPGRRLETRTIVIRDQGFAPFRVR